jgi:hypothetical protein
MLGEPPLPSAAGLGLEPVDEVDDVIKSSPGAAADAASRDGDGQMGLSGPGTADQHDVALLGDEGGLRWRSVEKRWDEMISDSGES